MFSKKKKGKIVRTVQEPISGARLRAVASVLREQSGDTVPSDVNGSYTGTPLDYSQPEQDPDDL